MMSGDDVLMMRPGHRIEVFAGTGRRRRWSAEQKAQIVEESHSTSVGEVAARYGVSKSQLFNWRREAKADRPGVEFARVEVEADDRGLIEIALAGAVVRFGPGAEPRMATAIIMALRAGIR